MVKFIPINSTHEWKKQNNNNTKIDRVMALRVVNNRWLNIEEERKNNDEKK